MGAGCEAKRIMGFYPVKEQPPVRENQTARLISTGTVYIHELDLETTRRPL